MFWGIIIRKQTFIRKKVLTNNKKYDNIYNVSEINVIEKEVM
jgi:hypothetical protein